MIDQDHIRHSFETQGLLHSFGAKLIRAGDGQCVIEAPITPAVSQQHGAAHAGLTFALGDSAAGYAAITAIEGQGDVVTVEMKINLLSIAVGDRLRATGRVVKAGRRLLVTTAEVHAITGDQEKLIAVMQGTMAPV